MTPMKIKAKIQELAQGYSEAEASKHDHALHDTLEKLHQKHGTRKLLHHMAEAIQGSDTADPANDTDSHYGDVADALHHLADKKAKGYKAGPSTKHLRGARSTAVNQLRADTHEEDPSDFFRNEE